jgi:CRP-like cAMP-binding protein
VSHLRAVVSLARKLATGLGVAVPTDLRNGVRGSVSATEQTCARVGGHCPRCDHPSDHESVMQTTLPAPTKNLLLAGLPARARRHLLAGCEQVQLKLSEVLHEPGARIEYVYFPTSSFISLITPVRGHDRLEVGLVGREGMLGTSLVLGMTASHNLALVQGPGAAWRMDTALFREELDLSEPLLRCLKRYIHVVMNQLSQMAVCTRFHVVEARLARWLLMTRDRAESDEFHVTHERLAHILGVRRAGVTHAATSLQTSKMIRYSRGDITILDHRRLRRTACPCYAVDRSAYTSVMV